MQFNQPYGVSVDEAGNVLVMDTGDFAVRIILNQSPVLVNTLAGRGILSLKSLNLSE